MTQQVQFMGTRTIEQSLKSALTLSTGQRTQHFLLRQNFFFFFFFLNIQLNVAARSHIKLTAAPASSGEQVKRNLFCSLIQVTQT